jgi:3-deoxy-D-manno-octulosonic-acid transferase
LLVIITSCRTIAVMQHVRDVAYGIGLAAISPVLAFNLLRSGKWRTDWRGRFGHCELSSQNHPSSAAAGAGPATKTLLLYAVSVGEVDAIRGLAARLEALGGDRLRLVIASATNTGHARARELFADRLPHPLPVVRYPLDFSWAVRRFLDAVRPDAVGLVELEAWPNFVDACGRRGIPVAVVNGRISAHSFPRYRRVRPLVRSTFASLAAVGAQDSDIAQRFIELGTPADRVRVMDTLKWDTARLVDDVPGSAELAAEMGIDRGRPLIVAGSTGPGEEKLLIDTCPPDAQLLLVPRKPERFDAVSALAPGMVRRTQWRGGRRRPLDASRLFLLDTIGELGKAYALADVALVGRSFLGMYGSNILEPIGLGRPTITGPHHTNFADAMSALIAADGIEVTDQPGPAAAALLADRARAADLARRGRQVIRSRQGVTDRYARMLLQLLGLPDPPAG